MGRILGLLPLEGVMLSVLCSVDRSIHLSFIASEIRIPVSLSVCSRVAVLFPHDAISWSSSVSVGMKGIFCCLVIFGFFQLIPKNFSSAV